MPGDGLALAIQVRREVDCLRLARDLDNLAHVFPAALVQLVNHCEIAVRVDRSVARRQVPDVPVRRQHLEVGPKVTVYRGRLGRGFYDQQFDTGHL